MSDRLGEHGEILEGRGGDGDGADDASVGDGAPPCPACGEALPAADADRCAACGERLGASTYVDLPAWPLRRVRPVPAIGLGACAPLATLLLVPLLDGPGGDGGLLGGLFLAFGLTAVLAGLAVGGDLASREKTEGVPFLLGLMVGIALDAVLIGVAVAGLSHARYDRQNETSAIGALKTISSAQALFREGDKENDGNLDYGTLAELGAAGTTGLIDAVLASGTKQGYLFQGGYGLSTSEFIWFATAEPMLPGTTGDRYFAVNQEGVVYYTTSSPFSLNLGDCSMPPGALPVGR
jgi:hypothetical protein